MLALLLVACNGCLKRPNTDEEQSKQDTSQPDSGDSGEDSAVDTSIPPGMCEYVLDETDQSHDLDYKTDIPIPLETWVCGYFESVIDFERFVFDVRDDSWLELEVEGQARGSSADVVMQAYPSVDDTDGCAQYASPGSADPRVVFPVDQGGEWTVQLAEQEQGWGDDYPWWFRASIEKAPVSYDMTFAALKETYGPSGMDGSTRETAVPYTENAVVFGQLAVGETQWYRVQIPAGANQIYIDTAAAEFGAHTDTSVYIYEEDAAGTLHYDHLDVDEAGNEGYNNSDSSYYSINNGSSDYVLGSYKDDDGNPIASVAVVFGVLHDGTDCATQFQWYTVTADFYSEDPPEKG
jgi:hypothetical protein